MADKKTAEVQPKYSREELLENAEALFNCKPEVIAGALHGNKQREFTVDEMKKLINDFLKRKVV
ncbi:hypothetical protein D2962_09455 [Biomaibacter acetigenes]|uniref:YqzN/YkzM domain-containing protein n=1 Tax=Biomaibacter acetigenes TaxID=2316383 RepID=A0A3G2R621_9FIRM|nr:hypothetical protein [Biomaibacter acetigenes]AYO30805.1 hypothetical protein D2962_09455 [Biomaibacter acetigenes]